ncbi:FAD/NAD(P)-binding domain-containing protein, partial [Mycena vitilis]
PLDVVVVGAGIGGLGAAIALRRNGHRVRIFEASQIKTEIGAGVGLQRNALGILQRFGYSRDNLRGVDFDGVHCGEDVLFDGTGQALFCHRSDLHDELKRQATGEGEGPPAQLLLGSKVTACDAEAGTITLDHDKTIHGDLVIGADGVHSTIRTSILGHTVAAPPSSWSCFRRLFDASGVEEIPELNWLTEGINGARSVACRDGGPLRMFFIYKCRDGSHINFVGFCTDSKQAEPDWKPTATREEMLDTFHDFHPQFMRVLNPAHTPILKWQLKVTPILPTWTRGCTALLGDAAHATLPLLGQGAAMAIEDAATLGCLLPAGTTTEDVPARFAAYQALRRERGEYASTESVAQAEIPEKRGSYLRSREMQVSLLEYDAVQVAQEYRNAHFGACEGSLKSLRLL